jgi:hypothetical protein
MTADNVECGLGRKGHHMDRSARLCPNILAQIIDRFGARVEARPETDSAEGWRFPLQRCKAVAQTQFGGSGKEYVSIDIVDLGMRGLGFRTDSPVTKGARFTVILRIPGMPLQTWNCRVVDVHSFDGKEYRAGATFEGPTAAGAVPVSAEQDSHFDHQS